MKLALALRGAMLAVALVVMLAPIPYLARTRTTVCLTCERGGVTHSVDQLTFRDAIGDSHVTRERLVPVWWGVCAAALVWSEVERRRGRASRAARGVRWALVAVASLLLFTRSIEIGMRSHADGLVGSYLVDVAAVGYLLAMIAGAIVRFAAAKVPTTR